MHLGSWRGECSLEERALLGDLCSAGMASLGAAFLSPKGVPFVLHAVHFGTAAVGCLMAL